MTKLITPDIASLLTTSYQQANQRLILLDYDGTLEDFTLNPKETAPSQQTTRLINRQISDPKNKTVIVSGRDADTLEAWFGDLPIGLVAEHGGLIKNSDHWVLASNRSLVWQENVASKMESWVANSPGTFTERKKTALVWHYRGALNQQKVKAFAATAVKEMSLLAKKFKLQVVQEQMAIEVRPRNINKGKAVKRWLNSAGFDLIIAAGDSRSDEDMFKTLPNNSITIKIGKSPSAARYSLKTPADLRNLLLKLMSAN